MYAAKATPMEEKNLPAERTRGDVRDTEYILFLGGNNPVQKTIPPPCVDVSDKNIRAKCPSPPYFGQLDNTTATADLKVLRCQGLRDFLVGCVRESLPVTPKQRRRRAQKIFCSSRRFFPFFLLCAPSLSPSCTFRRFGTRRRKKRTSQRGNKSRSKIFILYAKARAWMLFSPLLPSTSSSNGRMVKMCPPLTHARTIDPIPLLRETNLGGESNRQVGRILYLPPAPFFQKW